MFLVNSHSSLRCCTVCRAIETNWSNISTVYCLGMYAVAQPLPAARAHYGRFAYTAFFANGHCKNRHPAILAIRTAVLCIVQRLFYSLLVLGEVRGFGGGRAPKARAESRRRGGLCPLPRNFFRFLVSK